MNILESIRHRRSVRTFEAKALTQEDQENILTYANEVTNPYGIPIIWRLLSVKEDKVSSQVIVGADTFIAGKMQRVPHAEEAFGYAFEKIVLFAESLGIGTTWIAGTMSRAAFERVMEVGQDEIMPCVSPLGYPADKMSLREKAMRKSIKADSRIAFEELFFSNSFSSPLQSSSDEALSDALEMVRLAPSAVNKQPWRIVLTDDAAHFYEKQSAGLRDGSGWDLQKIDIGIAMYHFEAAMAEHGKTVSFTMNDPGIDTPNGTEYMISCKF